MLHTILKLSNVLLLVQILYIRYTSGNISPRHLRCQASSHSLTRRYLTDERQTKMPIHAKSFLDFDSSWAIFPTSDSPLLLLCSYFTFYYVARGWLAQLLLLLCKPAVIMRELVCLVDFSRASSRQLWSGGRPGAYGKKTPRHRVGAF